MYNLIDSPPLVGVLGLSADDAETFKYVDDVVNSTTFYLELNSALIKQ